MIFSNKPFTLSLISLAVLTSTAAYANSPQQSEIEQLRQEIEVLKSMMEQQQKNAVVQTKSIETLKTESVKPQPKLNVGKDTTFNFYGNVRLDASYQAEGSGLDRLYNNINKVPLTGNNEASDQLKSTLSATRLGLDIHSQINDKKVSGKVEVDFLGGAGLDNLRIRHAYMNYDKWLIGQTWSNFAVPDYMPETIDALGYVGGAVKRTPQVRYSMSLAPATGLVLAAEDPKDGLSKMRTPAVTARLNHQLNDDAKLSLRTMVNEKKTEVDEVVAWGVGLGMQYKLAPSTTLKADYYHVKGDSSFVSWMNPGISRSSSGEILDENEFDSITIGLTQQFNTQWRGTVGFGYMNQDVTNAYRGGAVNLTEINKELWQGWVNAFYSPIKPISLGLEYVYGERKAVVSAPNGSNTGEDNRVSAVAIYNF